MATGAGPPQEQGRQVGNGNNSAQGINLGRSELRSSQVIHGDVDLPRGGIHLISGSNRATEDGASGADRNLRGSFLARTWGIQ